MRSLQSVHEKSYDKQNKAWISTFFAPEFSNQIALTFSSIFQKRLVPHSSTKF